MANLSEHLFRQSCVRPNHIALRFGTRSYTFKDLADGVRTAATHLRRVGLHRGSRVGLMMSSRPEFILYEQAIFALGAILAPINILFREAELQHCVRSCGLDYLILDEDAVARLPNLDALQTAGEPRMLVASENGGLSCRGASIPNQTGESFSDPVEVPASAPAMLLSTSATTGKSKGVILTLANLQANYDRTPDWLGLTEHTVILGALPLYNTFALNQCINALMVTGGSLVLMPRFDAATCIDLIARHRCTFLPAVPTMLQKILDHPDARKRDLSSLRCIMTGGAPVPATLLQRVATTISPDAVVLTGYGLTEATALVTLTRVRLSAAGTLCRPKTIGQVLDGMELSIFSADGQMRMPVGETGEICIRGPNIMQGYFQMPEETTAVLAGGWLHTGDLGYLDEAGYAYIVDRKKDVIIRGGQNIYPADIEETLYQLADVTEAAVIAKADPVLGEIPVAFLAVRVGSALSADAVIEHCKARLACFKVPAAVHFLPELPKGPTGKILRRALNATRN